MRCLPPRVAAGGVGEAVEVRLRCLEWPVHALEGEVEEERRRRKGGRCVAYDLHRTAREEVGRVGAVGGEAGPGALCQVVPAVGRVGCVILRARPVAVVRVEAARLQA